MLSAGNTIREAMRLSMTRVATIEAKRLNSDANILEEYLEIVQLYIGESEKEHMQVLIDSLSQVFSVTEDILCRLDTYNKYI